MILTELLEQEMTQSQQVRHSSHQNENKDDYIRELEDMLRWALNHVGSDLSFDYDKYKRAQALVKTAVQKDR